MQRPGAGECLACIQETARKRVNENARDSILGHGGETGKEKACKIGHKTKKI